MANMAFTGQSAPDMRRKLQLVEEAIDINPSGVVGIAYRIENAWEEQILETIFVLYVTSKER
jgi:hypothetical protein